MKTSAKMRESRISNLFVSMVTTVQTWRQMRGSEEFVKLYCMVVLLQKYPVVSPLGCFFLWFFGGRGGPGVLHISL